MKNDRHARRAAHRQDRARLLFSTANKQQSVISTEMKQKGKARTRYLAGFGAAFFAVSGFAQGIDAGALTRQQQPSSERPALPAAPQITVPTVTEQSREPSGKTIFVQAYRLATKSALIDDTQVNALLSGYRGRNVTFAEIQEAAELVGQKIRDQGYFLTRAYLPAQEIQDGIVTIAVMSGRMTKDAAGQAEVVLKLSPSVRINPDFAKAVVANALSDDGPVKLEQIERGVLLLNELPGIQAAGTVTPGSEPGTVGLALQLSEGIAVHSGVSVDNYGARTTGEVRSSAIVEINDMNGRGDTLGTQVVSSDGMKIIRSAYTTPLGTSGLKATIAGSYLSYKQGKELAPLDYHGSSDSLSLGLSYPFLLTRAQSLFAVAQVEKRKIFDLAGTSDISNKRVHSISMGVQQSLLLNAWSAASSFGAYVITGKLDRSHVAADLEQDAATQQTNGRYTVVRLSEVYEQYLTSRFSLRANFSGQTANKNLDSSEKFYLGGPRGVRAYPIEEGAGDDGALLSVEGRWRPPGWSAQTDLAIIGFLDIGWIRKNHLPWSGWNSGNPEMPNVYALKGTGVGISLITQQRGKVELFYAHKIGSNPGRTMTGMDANGRSDPDRIWLTAALLFL